VGKIIYLFLALTLIACGTPEQRQAKAEHDARIQTIVDNVIPVTFVSISCVGHADALVTGYSLRELDRNEWYGGGTCGGTNAAGYPLPDQWRPGMKVSVRWKLNKQPWRERTAYIKRYHEVGALFVHIYNSDEIRVVSSNTYPSGAMHPISGDSKIPPPEEQ
jgi:hypothetical protein